MGYETAELTRCTHETAAYIHVLAKYFLQQSEQTAVTRSTATCSVGVPALCVLIWPFPWLKELLTYMYSGKTQQSIWLEHGTCQDFAKMVSEYYNQSGDKGGESNISTHTCTLKLYNLPTLRLPRLPTDMRSSSSEAYQKKSIKTRKQWKNHK